MLQNVVYKFTTAFWYNKRGFRMRCGLLSVDMGDRPPTKRDGTRRSLTEPDCLSCSAIRLERSQGHSKTSSPALPTTPSPTPSPPMADLQYYCSFAKSLKRVSNQLAEVRQVLIVFRDLTPRNMVNTYRRFGASSRDIYGLQG